MNKNALKTIVWQEGDYFVSQCLNVDVASFGDTRKEALTNLREALALYFEDPDTDEASEVTSPELIETTL